MVTGLRRRGTALVLTVLLGAVHSAWAAGGGQPLSLEEAVKTALATNPALQAAASGQEIADARLREAQDGWLPSVQLSETFTRSNNPVFVFGSLLEQSRFTQSNFSLDALNDPSPLNNYRSAATANYPLFEQFRTETGIAKAELGLRQADSRRDGAEQQVRFEVIRAYFGVLVAEARVGVAQEAVRTGEADRSRVEDMYKAGLVVHSDLLATEVQLAEFHQQAIQAAGERDTAYAALNTALGLPVSTPQTLSGELAERTFPMPDPQVVEKEALVRRADYTEAELAVDMARQGERAARSQYLPRLDLFATYAGSAHTPGVDSTDYTVGAGLTFNLLAPGRSPRVDQARSGISLAQAQRQQVANRISFEVVQACQRYRSAREQLDVAQRAVTQAQEALRIVQDRYQEGLTTITEVLRSETALVRSRLNLLAARYQVYVGYAQVMLAGGTLVDVSPFAT